ncbi:MAG: hypothetical protein M0P23_07240, partial [Bacteroidales bacterium]|nr:hypothetical protein [Bacteroidales bacterium]
MNTLFYGEPRMTEYLRGLSIERPNQVWTMDITYWRYLQKVGNGRSYFHYCFHFPLIISLVCFILYDSPCLWKAFHKQGDSLRKKNNFVKLIVSASGWISSEYQLLHRYHQDTLPRIKIK